MSETKEGKKIENKNTPRKSKKNTPQEKTTGRKKQKLRKKREIKKAPREKNNTNNEKDERKWIRSYTEKGKLISQIDRNEHLKEWKNKRNNKK